MSRNTYLLVLCIIAFSIDLQAQTDSRWRTGVDFTKRAAAREQTRWSLSDWLEIKNRSRMMDMWLTMNSPSPFEFATELTYINNEVKHPTIQSNLTSYAGSFTAHVHVVGLTAEYENNTTERHSDLAGMFNLRILGNSLQNTSLTLQYGQLTRELGSATLKPQFAQATFQLYILKYFGIEAKYRQFVPFNDPTLGEVTGQRTQAGVFIDFNAFRVFGAWYEERLQNKIPAGIESDYSHRTGIQSGIKIFF